MTVLRDVRATRLFGARLAEVLRRGDCILLRGPLGAGKTELARSIIRSRAGEKIDVPSPTFSLVETYEFDTPLFHIDLYRLESPDQAVELGLEDLFELGVALIEWPDRAAGLLPRERLEITIGQREDEVREVKLKPVGADWARRIEAFEAGEAR